MARVAALLLVLVLAGGCGGEEDPAGSGSRETPSPTASSTPPAPPTARPSSTTPAPTPTASRPARGVDVSHHQGAIDWRAVARDRIEFAYLKATEGSGFSDPRFRDNARGAARAGLRVGGYHFFSTCSPGAPQAEHFLSVLAGSAARTLPPAVDLELVGNCAEPPPREVLLREVRTFIDIVERQRGRRVVVYAFPDFEARYRFAPELDRRQWVRRLGARPPTRDWWIWQRTDDARVAGIEGPADLNVMRPVGP
jgi:lysozyme